MGSTCRGPLNVVPPLSTAQLEIALEAEIQTKDKIVVAVVPDWHLLMTVMHELNEKDGPSVTHYQGNIYTLDNGTQVYGAVFERDLYGLRPDSIVVHEAARADAAYRAAVTPPREHAEV